jgi:hypothetical protein
LEGEREKAGRHTTQGKKGDLVRMGMVCNAKTVSGRSEAKSGLSSKEVRCRRKVQVQVQLAIVEMRHVTRVPDCPKPSAVSTPLPHAYSRCLARAAEGLEANCDWTGQSRPGRSSLPAWLRSQSSQRSLGGSAGPAPILVASTCPGAQVSLRVITCVTRRQPVQ